MNENSLPVVAAYLLNRSGKNDELSVSFRDPQWFEKGVAAQKIPIRYINLYTHKCILGSWADTKSKNANDVLLFSADIIKYAHNLLTNYKLTEITVYHKYDGFLKIKTEDKIWKAYKCSESVFENGWKNYCLLHMNYLNTLCGSPFMTTKYHETFNGTFIYKLLKDMDGGDEKEFIAELFKTAPSVLTFVNKLISTYEKLLKGPD
ncbi:unnamed protein product [Arctia plantaginis]|nr:unnamed protein product [Arctia plantaginis]